MKGTRYFCSATGSLLLAAALSASSALLSPAASSSAKRKIDRINSGGLRNGETVTLSENEINSFFKYDHAGKMADGVREVKVKLQEGGAVVRVLVDLSRSQGQNGAPGGILWLFLFSGEREVTADCRYRSAEGYGRLDLDSVEIDGTMVPQFVVDWLIASYVNPQTPDFEVGRDRSLAKKGAANPHRARPRCRDGVLGEDNRPQRTVSCTHRNPMLSPRLSGLAMTRAESRR